jgi:hypothetical protein
MFVELCHVPRDDGRFNAFARFQDLRGRAWDVALGPFEVNEPFGWLVDGTHGRVYAWTSFDHGLFRIDAATRALSVRLLAGLDSNGSPTVPTVTPEATSAHATPDPHAGPAAWQPTARATETIESPLVGSPDGRLLYAAGLSFGVENAAGGPGPTGIWVFDAGSLALVDHWAPALTYRALGLHPNGRYLVATGEPSAEEVAAFGNHGAELAVLDRRNGSVVVILRELGLRLGGTPLLLPAPPPAGRFVGFGG